jgi:hypothetical protein
MLCCKLILDHLPDVLWLELRVLSCCFIAPDVEGVGAVAEACCPWPLRHILREDAVLITPLLAMFANHGKKVLSVLLPHLELGCATKPV